MRRADRNNLELFIEIARAGNLRQVADTRGLTASAVSHALASLENQLNVRLFNRTTRKMSLTPAGEQLFHDLVPSFHEISASLDRLNHHRIRPEGRLRVTTLRDAATLLLAPHLSTFVELYPEIEIEISVDDRYVDVVAEGFDLGIRYGGTVPEGMIASRLTPELDWVVVGAPSYLDRYGRPQAPDDLVEHRCIRIRTGAGRILSWELGAGDEMRRIDVRGPLILGDSDLSLSAAKAGQGLFYCLKDRVKADLVSGELEIALPEWVSPGEGFCAYYASRRQLPHALRLFIDHLRKSSPWHD